MTTVATNYQNFYVRVKDLMKNDLPYPKLKRTIFVTGWNEFLPLVTVEAYN